MRTSILWMRNVSGDSPNNAPGRFLKGDLDRAADREVKLAIRASPVDRDLGKFPPSASCGLSVSCRRSALRTLSPRSCSARSYRLPSGRCGSPVEGVFAHGRTPLCPEIIPRHQIVPSVKSPPCAEREAQAGGWLARLRVARRRSPGPWFDSVHPRILGRVI